MGRTAQRASRTPVWAVALVLLSTLLIAAAHVLLKEGVRGPHPLLLLGGIVLLGCAGALVTMAFKHGELSALHALIGLGFLWTTLIGVFLLGERLAAVQAIGIGIILLGVALITHGSTRRRAR